VWSCWARARHAMLLKMERLEALTELGLDGSATREQIESAWRGAIKVVHPEGTHPDPDAARRLNEAREVALVGLEGSAGDALVRLSEVMDLVRAQAQQPVAVAGAERALRRVVMHHVGLLAYRKRERTVLAAISGGLAAALGVITAIIRAYDSTRYLLGFVAATLGLLAAVLGFLAWRVSIAEQTLRLQLEEAAETLSDRAAFVDTINEIGLGRFWTRADLHGALDRWEIPDGPWDRTRGSIVGLGPSYRSVPLARTAERIGPVDFGRLLVAKGIELGLIEESATTDGNGIVGYGYSRT
jgi:hypothetical protein